MHEHVQDLFITLDDKFLAAESHFQEAEKFS